jgi:hypothetical protein
VNAEYVNTVKNAVIRNPAAAVTIFLFRKLICLAAINQQK